MPIPNWPGAPFAADQLRVQIQSNMDHLTFVSTTHGPGDSANDIKQCLEKSQGETGCRTAGAMGQTRLILSGPREAHYEVKEEGT